MSTNTTCSIYENKKRYKIASFMSLHRDYYYLEKGRYYTIKISYLAPNTSIVYQSKYGKWELLDKVPNEPFKFKANLQHGVLPTPIAKRLCKYGINNKIVKLYNDFIDSYKYMGNEFNKSYIRIIWQFLD